MNKNYKNEPEEEVVIDKKEDFVNGVDGLEFDKDEPVFFYKENSDRDIDDPY